MRRASALLAMGAALLAGCRAEPEPVAAAAASATPAAAQSFYGTAFEQRPSAAALTTLGRALFADASLSASGKLSCASCHDPASHYGPPNGLPVQLGGAGGRSPGLRAVPTLMYAQDAPPFSEHYSDTDGDDSIDQGPTGGRGWDGRASSAHEQAALPLLSAEEMANASREQVVAKLRASPNATLFRATFGALALDDAGKAWNGLLLALEVFQQSPADFYPYSSKYDAFLRGRATLSPAEERGLRLFDDPRKGNCAQCHLSHVKRGAFPQFTDRGLIALGVPRNARIAANAAPAVYDLGLCGPLRSDLAGRAEYCGLFKTPTLRNVASRKAFFHNGVFHRLDEAVRFYVLRDARPARVYPRDAAGRVKKYDDLPERYAANVNADPPFGSRARPVLSEPDIADVVAFLRTLDDGYVAAAPAARR